MNSKNLVTNNGITLDYCKLIILIASENLSISEFCEKADIYSGTYQRIKKGEWLRPKTVNKIAKALDVRVEDLI